jgi:diphthine-ammonia ligase
MVNSALVGADLEGPARLQVDVIARRFDDQTQKQTMHVQGISYWAPANIGPYSQSVVVSPPNCNGYVVRCIKFLSK